MPPGSVLHGWREMTNEDRNRVWANRPRYLNQLATIKFPYTSGDSVPLQSVFIAWRNYGVTRTIPTAA